MSSAAQDLIKRANFWEDRLRGFGAAKGRILAFSIDLLRRLSNTLALPCECVIVQSCDCQLFLIYASLLVSNCFFHTETTEKYPSFADSLRLPVHRSCSGIIEAGLWECKICWSPVVPATPVAVGDECSSTISVQCESV